MKLTGKITKALPEISGMSKTGNLWRKREYVCVYDETNTAYPKGVLFSVMKRPHRHSQYPGGRRLRT